MRKTILTLLLAILTLTTATAQNDVVSAKTAIEIFKGGDFVKAKATLAKQGYKYAGMANLNGSEFCFSKNVQLSKEFIPQSYSAGNSSVIMMSTAFDAKKVVAAKSDNSKVLSLYVYNQKAFAGLQSQVRQLGYNIQREKDGSLLCTRDGEPTISFLRFEMPYPFCMMITE